MIDLHTHSTFSDGSLAPEELVALAVKTGLSAIALTDHDTIGGVNRFMTACGQVEGLEGIPGVEISVDHSPGTMHMLGYFVRQDCDKLNDVLVRIREGRSIRNKQIFEKLNEIGLTLEWKDIEHFAGEEVVGRPHFAQAMVKKGYVSSEREAFDKYLAKTKVAYVDRLRLSAEESIAAIREAGGLAVLSHPFTLGLNNRDLKECVAELVGNGLSGIEVFYSEHNREQVENYLNLAKEFKLVATGGTDFHGDLNPAIKLGTGFGSLNVKDGILADMKARLTNHA